MSSGGGGDQLDVHIHDLCGLYTQAGERDDLHSPLVRMDLITIAMMILYQECQVGNVFLLSCSLGFLSVYHRSFAF